VNGTLGRRQDVMDEAQSIYYRLFSIINIKKAEKGFDI
jgi:hypothetical protein